MPYTLTTKIAQLRLSLNIKQQLTRKQKHTAITLSRYVKLSVLEFWELLEPVLEKNKVVSSYRTKSSYVSLSVE